MRASWRVAAIVAALVTLGALVFGGAARDRLRGCALYHGHVALTARIDGQSFDLPPIASRCAACHEAGLRQAARNGELSLDLSRLDEPRSRRGGPPSAYNAESFCAVMRTGIDPTSIVLARAMPRFTARDEDCRALWAYLVGR